MPDRQCVSHISELNAQTVVVFGSATVTSLAAVHFQAFESFCQIARRFEYLQVDELMVVALVLCAAFLYLFVVRDLQVRRHIRDVELQQTRALQAANEDELTGLPNRRALKERLRVEGSGNGMNHSVLMLDLDGFKSVNDRHGHEAGDDVLRCVAARLKSLCERWPGMLVARLGGDEFFCVIDSRIPSDAVDQLAETIVQELTAPMPQCGGITVGVSVGIASVLEAAATNRLLQQADVAMYRAKRAGGSCFKRTPSLAEPMSPQCEL